MNTVKIEREVPKEMKEVGDLLIGLIGAIKAKKSITQIASEQMPALILAVEGFDKLSEEVKSAQAKAYYGILAGDIAASL